MLTKLLFAAGIIITIYITEYSALPLVIVNAQVPAQEFSLNKTCSHSETDPAQYRGSEFVPNNVTIYDNASLGFRIEYPADWKLSQDDCTLESQGFSQSSSILNFVSSSESKDSGLVGITVSDFIFTEPIDTFVNIYSEDFANIIKSKEVVTFAGLPAAKFILEEGDHDRLLITTFANDRKYDITLPIISWFSNSTIQSMLHSFQVINPDTNGTNQADLMNELG